MQFVKLTCTEKGDTVFVNLALVEQMFVSEDGNVTVLMTGPGSQIEVRETPEQILILMTKDR